MNPIKRKRLEHELTMGQLAEMAKIGKSTLSDIESNRHNPSVRIAISIADILEVENLRELFPDDSEASNN